MSDKPLTLGVVGRALKPDEKRAPIHPDHLGQIPEALRARILLERRYGERFGVSDDRLAPLVGGLVDRAELFMRSDIILLPKPTTADFSSFRDGQVLWGWPHCVQGRGITQLAIDRRLTLIAWEVMNRWEHGRWAMHIFQKNNELAGYGSVQHALALRGQSGLYGRPLRACVIGFGSVGRGAVHALQGLGFRDITLMSEVPGPEVKCPIPGLSYGQMLRGEGDSLRVVVDGGEQPMAQALGGFDVIVNAILQDTDDPLMYVHEHEIGALRPGSLIVDVSCDAGMGFAFAKPTSFADPAFQVGDNILYYAVDHSPSLLWDAATWEISTALLPFLPIVMAGPEAWQSDETIRRAVEIQNGVVLNPKILSFQRRAAEYPHAVVG